MRLPASLLDNVIEVIPARLNANGPTKVTLIGSVIVFRAKLAPNAPLPIICKPLPMIVTEARSGHSSKELLPIVLTL